MDKVTEIVLTGKITKNHNFGYNQSYCFSEFENDELNNGSIRFPVKGSYKLTLQLSDRQLNELKKQLLNG